jgi:intracellular septation protein A
VFDNHGVTASREPDVVIEVGELRPHLLRAVRIFCETVFVPTLLLFAVMHMVGLVTALSAVLGWCALTLIVRWVAGHQMPSTLLLCVGLLVGRTSLALALSSAVVYLLQPAFGSLLMAVLFLGSAAMGRPVTARLARDFIALPAHLFHREGVRRMFTQVAMVWGGSRLLDGVMSIGLLHWGVDAGLLSRGVFSGALTTLTIVGCALWGWRSLRRLPGVTLRWRLGGSAA